MCAKAYFKACFGAMLNKCISFFKLINFLLTCDGRRPVINFFHLQLRAEIRNANNSIQTDIANLSCSISGLVRQFEAE